MEFPSECTKNVDRLEVVYGTISQLMTEHKQMGEAYRNGDISLGEFKKWEKETFRPMHKHALHLKNQYKRILKLNPKGEDDLPQDKKDLKDQLKNSGRNRDKGKYKNWFKNKKSKDLIAPWDKDTMNQAYASLQAEAEAAEAEELSIGN